MHSSLTKNALTHATVVSFKSVTSVKLGNKTLVSFATTKTCWVNYCDSGSIL